MSLRLLPFHQRLLMALNMKDVKHTYATNLKVSHLGPIISIAWGIPDITRNFPTVNMKAVAHALNLLTGAVTALHSGPE
jgi:hypothetical protein